ncbi:MAG: InlB B-repeat-containing protein, partial [Clostridia bacterium]|nr:InlB B-repeat-containing protein [Clostridia bacterium]
YQSIPQDGYVFVARKDIKLKNKFEDQYIDYVAEYERKEKQKRQKSAKVKKALIAVVAIIIIAALIAGSTVFALYKPTITIDSINATMEIDNSSFGVFNKLGIDASVDEISEGSDYDSASASISKITSKYILYDIRFTKKGKEIQPKDGVAVTMPIPDSLIKQNSCVYFWDGKEGVKEVECEHSLNYDNIMFKVTECGIYAIVEKSFIISFADTGNMSYDNIYVMWGEKIQRPSVDPTKKGYDFGGWYDGAKEFDFDAPIKQSKTISPKWIGRKYTAILNLDGGYMNGNSSTMVTVTYGSNFKLGVASKSNKTFLGWKNSNGDLVTDSQGNSLSKWDIDGDARLTASWGKASSLSAVYVDTQTRRIKTEQFKNNYSDSIYLPGLFGDSISTLKNLGYTKMELRVEIDIREIDDGYQEFFITKHPTTTENGNCLYYQKNIEHGPGKKLTTMGTYTYSTTIDLNLLSDNIYVLYSAHGSGGNDWYRDRIKLNFTIS